MILQNTEAALAQLELAMTKGVSLGSKLDDNVFDPIRSTPRFKAILAQNDLILHPCADAPHRVFDFWVGDWTVTTQNGPRVGDSSIKRILNDCVILESWTGAGGGTGQSFNNYDARSKTWKQFWVDASGSRQEYEEGVYQDGALRFTGHNPGPEGEPVQQRSLSSISTPITSGSCRSSPPTVAKHGLWSTTSTTPVKSDDPYRLPAFQSSFSRRSTP